MDILRFAQTLYQKSVTLLKYHRRVAMTGSVDHVVLVQKDTGEKVCWFYGDMGFSSGVYGDEAEAAFADRTKESSKPFVTKTIDLTKPDENVISQGGFPVGKVACIAGPSSSGKSLFKDRLDKLNERSDIRFPPSTPPTTTVDQNPPAQPQCGKGMPDHSRKVVFANINQARREIAILEEVPGKYTLGVYTMPAGRAFLCRVYPKFQNEKNYPTTPASKKERCRHAKAVLEAQRDAAYDLLDACDGLRGRWVQMRSRVECKQLIAKTELALKNLAANS